jgi:HSP20 family protein
MAIVHMDPFRDLMTLQDRVNRIFDDSLRGRGQRDDWALGGAWAPAVDVYEKDGSIVLKAELPGIDPKDVDVRVENSVITLSGKRELSQEVDKESYHRVERSYGAFTRSFTLPTTADTSKIQAGYKDGLLTLTIPKREDAKPRQIRIDVA